MTKWQWAALWKRAAKKQRHEADRYFVTWIKAVVQLGWRGRQARAWKAAAKKWRRKASMATILTADEILLILGLLSEKYGSGYSEEKEIALLQTKLSVLLEVQQRSEKRDGQKET